MTDLDLKQADEIMSAMLFVKKYYPSFWDRIPEEKDIIHLIKIGYLIFKLHPEYLEANTDHLRGDPTQ